LFLTAYWLLTLKLRHAQVLTGFPVSASTPAEHKGKNWKLLIDPFIKGKTHEKVVRFGGTLDGPDVSLILLSDTIALTIPIYYLQS